MRRDSSEEMIAVRRRGQLELSASIRVRTFQFQVAVLMCRGFANRLRCRLLGWMP